jgi:hypothetical protein
LASTMKDDRQEKRERLFDRFSADLGEYHAPYGTYCVCPLCKLAYDRSAVAESGPLSLEHCIPRSLGGSACVLSCKKCNNQAGGKVDAHLQKKFRHDDFFQGVGLVPVDGFLTLEGHRVGVDLLHQRAEVPGEKSTLMIRMINNDRCSDPKVREEVSRAFRERTVKRLGIRPNIRYSPWKASLTAIKSAYLLMFRQFGHGYLLSDAAEVVRRQLVEPQTRLIPEDAIHPIKERIPDELTNRAAVVIAPREIRSFFVPMRFIESGRPRLTSVFLPGYDDDPEGFYDRFQGFVRTGQRFDIEFTYIIFKLCREEGWLPPWEAWDDIIGVPPGKERIVTCTVGP